MNGAWTNLLDLLKNYRQQQEICIAYSGGLDSRFLVHAALHAGVSVELIHVAGPHVAKSDTEYAVAWAKENSLESIVIYHNPLENAEILAGSRQRCYACKRDLFEIILQSARGKILCDGTHHSDTIQYRPGLRALAELSITNPLLEAGFDKQSIREYAVKTGLSNPHQKARPCLLTRLPYDFSPNIEILNKIEEGEKIILQCLLEHFTLQSIPDFRLRCLATEFLTLHINQALIPHIHQEIQLRLAQENIYAEIKVLERLSGFFDKNENVSTS